MKQKLKTGMAAIILSLFSFYAFAQEETQIQEETQVKVPRWVPGKGYWVVESNTRSSLNHIIWFYNNDNVLIYKEALSGVKFNPAKRKVKMKLKKALEKAVLVWEQKRVPEENKEYLSAILK